MANPLSLPASADCSGGPGEQHLHPISRVTNRPKHCGGNRSGTYERNTKSNVAISLLQGEEILFFSPGVSLTPPNRTSISLHLTESSTPRHERRDGVCPRVGRIDSGDGSSGCGREKDLRPEWIEHRTCTTTLFFPIGIGLRLRLFPSAVFLGDTVPRRRCAR